MKIIHCSDIHLDSKMESNFTPEQAKQRNHEICHTFEKMIQFAHENDVRVIMICGDLFDNNRVLRTTFEFVMETIRRYSHITFLYLPGNHDKDYFTSRTPLPPNLKLFTDEWKYYKAGNIVFSGIEITEYNKNTLYDNLHLNNNCTNIVLMHGQIGSCCGIDLIDKNRISGKSIDYLALGHYHSYEAGEIDYRGTYCYSGCLEGRGFDECGSKGFVLLSIEDKHIHPEFIPFASRTLHKSEVNVSCLKNNSEILNEVRNSIKNIPENDLIKITLNGINGTMLPIDVEFIRDVVSLGRYYVQILDSTQFLPNMDNKNSSPSLKSEFMNLVLSDNSLSEAEKTAILNLGLSALKGNEVQL